jgi:hypothetical protein
MAIKRMAAKRPQRSKQELPSEPIDDAPRYEKPLPIIKVVGLSGSGKSTLVGALRAQGYDARPVSQEHSNVPTLWQQFDRAAYLIYLAATLENQQARRQDVSWSAAAYQEEVRRLAHAREHADLRINTAELTPAEVCEVAISFLRQRRVRHADQALSPLPATGSASKASTSRQEP